jgi:NAD(P)-dependent dehydrogenase (short-subunit alcohol dehydrogenase family)
MASPKIAIVTGANVGLGYAAVRALLQSDKPYHVLLGSRSVEKGSAAVENIQKECPGVENTVELLELDLGSDESIEKAFDQVKAKHGHIDILINNAGT